jgi:hypothetical protein
MQAYYIEFDRAGHRLGFAPAVVDACGGSTRCGELSGCAGESSPGR